MSTHCSFVVAIVRRPGFTHLFALTKKRALAAQHLDIRSSGVPALHCCPPFIVHPETIPTYIAAVCPLTLMGIKDQSDSANRPNDCFTQLLVDLTFIFGIQTVQQTLHDETYSWCFAILSKCIRQAVWPLDNQAESPLLTVSLYFWLRKHLKHTCSCAFHNGFTHRIFEGLAIFSLKIYQKQKQTP